MGDLVRIWDPHGKQLDYLTTAELDGGQEDKGNGAPHSNGGIFVTAQQECLRVVTDKVERANGRHGA